MEHSVLIEGGLVVTPGGARELDVLVVGEHIVAVAVSGAIDGSGEVVDARGMVVLPGAVDGHTHLMQHDPDVLAAIPDEYEGFEAGGRGAAAGGVTTVVEMPQASPLTTDGHTFRRKRELAGTHAIVDYALWGGVTAGQDPAAIRQQLDEGAVGLKAFMCDSDPDFPPVDTAELASALEVLAPTGVMMGLHA